MFSCARLYAYLLFFCVLVCIYLCVYFFQVLFVCLCSSSLQDVPLVYLFQFVWKSVLFFSTFQTQISGVRVKNIAMVCLLVLESCKQS